MRCALALAALAACGGGTHLGFDAGTDDGPVTTPDDASIDGPVIAPDARANAPTGSTTSITISAAAVDGAGNLATVGRYIVDDNSVGTIVQTFAP